MGKWLLRSHSPQPGAKALRLCLCGVRARKEDYSLGDPGSRAGPNSQVCLLSICAHPTSPPPFQDRREWRYSLALGCCTSHLSLRTCSHHKNLFKGSTLNLNPVMFSFKHRTRDWEGVLKVAQIRRKLGLEKLGF